MLYQVRQCLTRPVAVTLRPASSAPHLQASTPCGGSLQFDSLQPVSRGGVAYIYPCNRLTCRHTLHTHITHSSHPTPLFSQGEAPSQFLLSDCTDANFLKQAPQGQMIWRNDPNYEILELLGCGVYGTVCRGRNLATGRVVAIKRIFMAQVCMGEFALLVTVGSFMFLCRVQCPRIPKNVYAYYVSPPVYSPTQQLEQL